MNTAQNKKRKRLNYHSTSSDIEILNDNYNHSRYNINSYHNNKKILRKYSNKSKRQTDYRYILFFVQG